MIEAFDPFKDAYEYQGVQLGCYQALSSLLIGGRDEND